jgi:single-stranded-DNA-specific exonuclease
MVSFPKNWKFKKTKRKSYKKLLECNISPILIKILDNRGIGTPEEVISFLKPTLKLLHNPDLLPSIDKGVKRVKKAILKNENVLIFGDYDTDGIISSVILYNFLKKLDLNVDIYIPNRFEEGYDIKLNYVRKISKEGKYSLIICVDCGTNSNDVKEYILRKKTNIDLIACDHHKPSTNDPVSGNKENYKKEKYIVINPKLKNSKYPFKDLSGGGVTFKFIISILRNLEEDKKKKFNKNYLTSLLDMVAISTIADVMPLTGENRIIVKNGLKIMKNTKNRGLSLMIEELLGEKDEINTYDIGYKIAPRLNAAGRMKNADNSVNLLKEDGKNFKDIVKELNLINKKRQKVQEKILEEIKKGNDFGEIIKNKRIFIGKSKSWNEGVIGVVASNLTKEFNIPVILFKEKGKELKGSGRSIKNFDLHSNLYILRGVFEKFGGHKQACGIIMKKSKFNEFKKEMVKIAYEKIKKTDTEKKFNIDLELNLSDIDNKLLEELSLMEPFGAGNPRPIFSTRDCRISKIEYLKDGQHVKLKLKKENIELSAIMFKVDDKIKNKLKYASNITIIYQIEENIWKGLKNIQLVILDLV